MSPDAYKRQRGAPKVPALASAVPSIKGGRRFGGGAALAGLLKAAQADNDRWPTIPMTPDAIVAMQHTALVARSRDQWANNDYVRSFIRIIRQNVVGPLGVTMQAKARTARGKPDKPLNDALEADHADWAKRGNCDVAGRLSWREIQCLAVVTAARDGEFIARLIYGPAAGPHGFAVQMIDPQRLPVWRNVDRLPNGNFLRHGIEMTPWGRPVAYHFTSTDETDSTWYSVESAGFVRIPAAEIIHGFLPEMVGQKRGLPWASGGLKRLRNVEKFEDAAVQNARAAATKMGFIEWDEGFGPELEDDASLNIEAEPLSFQELPQGARIADWDPLFPSADTAPFLKAQLRGAASGMGVPYNELGNDLEGVNFSSIRQMTLDAREHYKEIQQWLIEALIEPVRSAHLSWRLLNGRIIVKGKPVSPDKLTALREAVTWQPRRWQWIDPTKDTEAALAAIRGGLTSPSQVIREQGRDPETVYREIADDMASMADAGIPADIIKFFFKGAAAGNVKTAAANDAPDGKENEGQTNE
ncbi:MAG: phage portal protein [Sphingopyxis macrogoltabida]|uniref:Phage portal protein n=1 Tax=Sphingopyxis macrogoltabida TaxID=33050 RepID=A0A2W5KYU5_SPHMC|nr:MAG: phage portal protein [Sphingopyxis macrogoltabida]